MSGTIKFSPKRGTFSLPAKYIEVGPKKRGSRQVSHLLSFNHTPEEYPDNDLI